MKVMRRWTAAMLAFAMCVTALGASGDAAAAAKPKISKSKLTLASKGKSRILKVTRASGAKLTWRTSNKKVAAVKKKAKYTAKVTAKAKGKAVISCKVKKGKKSYTLKCNVTVNGAKKKNSTPAPTTNNAVTAAPVTNNTVTAAPAATSTAAPAVPEETPHLDSDSMLERFHGIFTYMGSSLNYDGWRGNKDLQDEKTLAFVKKHFNSFTLEDEMKPDSVFVRNWGSPTLISIDEAEKLGYDIPIDYIDEKVPKLNFDKLDKALEAAYKNGLKMRAHTLVWHQQTPDWFFSTDYANREVTTPEYMDGRLEFYIRTVMRHMMDKEKELTGANGTIIYVWDVVNEYLHRTNAPSPKSWADVYGDMGLEPTYVKRAFEIAYEMLEEYGVEDKVILYNNDYDNFKCADDIVKLVAFINKDRKICGGIGMQSHLDINLPTVEQYGAVLDKYLATGLEVQITELDVTINCDVVDDAHPYKDKGETNEDQAAFMGDFMRMVVKKQKGRDRTVNPKGITGITIWGLVDSYSWRKEMKPLLFDMDQDSTNPVFQPKPSFYTFMDAAKAWFE